MRPLGGALGLAIAWALDAMAAERAARVHSRGSPTCRSTCRCCWLGWRDRGRRHRRWPVAGDPRTPCEHPRCRSARITSGRRSVARTHSPRLVALQLALSTCLVVGAALLLQSTWNLQRLPLGFSQPDRLLTGEHHAPAVGRPGTWTVTSRSTTACCAKPRALPGVPPWADAAASRSAMATPGCRCRRRRAREGQPMRAACRRRGASCRAGYFSAMDVPDRTRTRILTRGRTRHNRIVISARAGQAAVAKRRGADRSHGLSRQWPGLHSCSASSATCG